jgi:hypothetical protein
MVSEVEGVIKKFKKPAVNGLVGELPAGGLSSLSLRKEEVPVIPKKTRRSTQIRYSVKIKMFALHKYLAINPKTGGQKYAVQSIVKKVNRRFGTSMTRNIVDLWVWRGGWKEILQGILDDAVHKTMSTMERRAQREAIVKVKLDEEILFDPISAMDVLYAPKYNKSKVATTIFRRAAEQNKLAHKSIKFAAEKGMLESSKEFSERLAVSAGEASSIFQASAKTMQAFIGLVENTSPGIAINNNIVTNTANVHQQQVSSTTNINLGTINYETVMLLMGNDQMKMKHPNKIQKIGGEEEGELIVPIDDEFIRSTETDKT